jgi:hypothetical protein
MFVAGRRKGAKLKSGVLPQLQMKARRKMKKRFEYEKASEALFFCVTQQIKTTNS